MSSKKDTPLTARRPRSEEKPRADVERAQRDISAEEPTKRVLADLPVSYTRRISAIRNMSEQNVPGKDLVQEALDDLFRKYALGNGRHAIANVEALKRHLGDLE